MKTLETDVEVGADGNVKLLSPLPAWLKPGRQRLLLVLEEEMKSEAPRSKGTPLEALEELRRLGGLRDVISDPLEWQREQRQDRPLPGRE